MSNIDGLIADLVPTDEERQPGAVMGEWVNLATSEEVQARTCEKYDTAAKDAGAPIGSDRSWWMHCGMCLPLDDDFFTWSVCPIAKTVYMGNQYSSGVIRQ